MSKHFTQWIALLWLTFAVALTVRAQSSTCITLSPPSSVSISNITPTSATASWASAGVGAWYRVELKNLNSGLVEDLIVTQALYRIYTGLHPGAHYRVSVQASTCIVGPFGATNSADFYTPTIIIDDIVNLDLGQQLPNQQNGYASADQLITQSQFTICIYKVLSFPPTDPLDQVFHAYIKLSNGDFFEFLMVGKDPDNTVHYSFRPLAVPRKDWSVVYLDESGHPTLDGLGAKVSTIIVSYWEGNQWNEKMSITSNNMAPLPDVLPLAVTIQSDVEFLYSVNQSNVCTPGSSANLQVQGGNPVSAVAPLQGVLAPNPFDDYLDLHIPGLESTTGTVRIFDPAGRLQFEFTSTGSGETMPQVITADWQPGLYYLQIQSEAGTSVQAIVKM